MKFKNLIYLILILPILMGGSCQKRMFEFTANANLDKIFVVDESSTFTLDETITADEIRKFLDDLPKDAKVTDVNISTLSVKISPQEGNQVSVLSLSGEIRDLESSELLFSPADYPVPLVGVDVAFFGLNSLIANGIGKMKRKIQRIIMENEFGSFELILNGSPKVGGSRLVVDIHVRVSIQIEYQQCVEVWDYIDAGEDCTL